LEQTYHLLDTAMAKMPAPTKAAEMVAGSDSQPARCLG
jgi:hypothetical protein